MFKEVHFNNVPSHLKKRNFVTPPNEEIQNAVLTNVWKKFLLEARKTFNKLVTQEWSIGHNWLSYYNPPNLNQSKSERTGMWFWKKVLKWQFGQVESNFDRSPVIFSTNSQKCSKNYFWKIFRRTIWKEFWQTCSKPSAQNPKFFFARSKTFFGSVHLDTFNAALESLVEPFTQS